MVHLIAEKKWPDIVFASDTERSSLSRAASRGDLRRLGPGIYTSLVFRDPAEVVKERWRELVAHELPGAIITDRSARSGVPVDGQLTVIHPRRRPLVLPGLAVLPRPGPGRQPGDTALPDGLIVASQARGLLENEAGAGDDRFMSVDQIEAWLADILDRQGESGLNRVRDEARRLAGGMRRRTALKRLSARIAAALTTGPIDGAASAALRSRGTGLPIDRLRVEAFRKLASALGDLAPDPIPALPQDVGRRALLPFYEAYFSNYIEGTEFTLDEAASIVFEGQIPTGRPEDAHDIQGTFAIVSDPNEMRWLAKSAEDFIARLKARHSVAMGGRPNIQPGEFKTRNNRAGSSIFVEPRMVEGTLRAGFEHARSVMDPFARAVYMMFVVSEVHPFNDGNGRVSRITMNAELVSAAQVRIVVPTVYRGNYLAALKGASHSGSFEPLAAVLKFAQRWTGRMDFTSRLSAERDLERTNALRDSDEAEDAGVRLTLP